MKKLVLILFLILGMSLSFAAIGLVMLFATGAVQSIEEVRALLMGQMPGGESPFLEKDEITQVQDALLLLQQHKQDLEQDLQRLKEDKQVLEQETASLSGSVKELAEQGQAASAESLELRKKRLEQLTTLYDAMRPADAAVIMDQMSDEMVLEILPNLKERQAARILNSLGDDERKARLSAQLVEGGPKGAGPQNPP